MSKTHNNFLSFLFQFSLLISGYLFYFKVLSGNSPERLIRNTQIITLVISWLCTAWLTHKYKPQYYQRKWISVSAPFIKAVFFHLFLVILCGWLLTGSLYPVIELIKCSLLYLSAELLIYSVIIVFYGYKKIPHDTLSREINKYHQDDLSFNPEYIPAINSKEACNNLSLFSEDIITLLHPSHFKFEPDYQANLLILSSIHELKNEKIKYPVCFLDRKINDLGRINRSFSLIYNALEPGGLFFATYKELEDFEKEFIGGGLPIFKFLKKLIYYLYYRAMPKIPWLNSIYWITSGGKNIVLSKAEILGRLYYSGFEVLKEIKNESNYYILARKSVAPSANPAPSFYPVIKLNRVGLYGTIIQIHKIRSMYPYSEFIQKKVFEEMSMTSTGKFGNDYRITKIGKFFRKYWIDELPQFLDWFRGKIKLVGIRAMSQHFFSLYPQEYKDLYYRVKPGIISPIFDEKTTGFEEIVQIEKKYLENYLKNPILTDIRYFFLTLKHILRGVRSK